MSAFACGIRLHTWKKSYDVPQSQLTRLLLALAAEGERATPQTNKNTAGAPTYSDALTKPIYHHDTRKSIR